MKKILLFLLLACTLSPTTLEQYVVIARSELQRKNPHKALEVLEQARKENPENLEITLLIATVHYVLNEFDTAINLYEQFLEKNPHYINARYNCATLYSKIGDFDKALTQYEQVYDKFKDDTVHSSLLKIYVRLKKWHKAAAFLAPRLWWYEKNIAGKTILLDVAQPGNGLGDCIQFLRYGKILNQAGAQIIVKTPKPLKLLFSNCNYLHRIITNDDPIPPYDASFDICIVSFLIKLQDQISMRIPQKPYLSVPNNLLQFWREKLKTDNGFKIGLCWESSLVKEKLTGEIKKSPRSISLESLKPLALPGVRFYSLQKYDESQPSPFPITQYTEDFDESHGRFMDTAALIMHMDLIISIDTSIVHLAGALGKKTWLILSVESDYRWFTNDLFSPLYPNVELFRQTQFGAWESVIAAIHNRLIPLVREIS